MDSVLLRGRRQARQLTLALEDASVSRLHQAWDQMADKEERTRAYFAQHGIEPDDVARELAEMEPVLGSPQDVQRFIANVIQRFNGDLRETRSNGVFLFEPGDLRDRIVARAGKPLFPWSIAFDGVAPPGSLSWAETTLLSQQRQRLYLPKRSGVRMVDLPGQAPFSQTLSSCGRRCWSSGSATS